MGFIAPILGGALLKKAITPKAPTVQTPEAQPAAQPAVSAPTADNKQETGVDTTGQTLKRKAKGKKGLMINTSGGGSAGGTGLNI